MIFQHQSGDIKIMFEDHFLRSKFLLRNGSMFLYSADMIRHGYSSHINVLMIKYKKAIFEY